MIIAADVALVGAAGATAESAHETVVHISWLTEWAIAAAALLLLMTLVHRRTIAFWSWAARSPARGRRVGFPLKLVVHAALLGALAGFVPLINYVFGVRAVRDEGVVFLTGEAVAAAWAVAAALPRNPDASVGHGAGVKALLLSAAGSTHGWLSEGARDAIPQRLAVTLGAAQSRAPFLARWRLAFAQNTQQRAAADVTAIALSKWPAMSDAERADGIRLVTDVIASERLTPGRLL